jgi:hypothetical protein
MPGSRNDIAGNGNCRSSSSDKRMAAVADAGGLSGSYGAHWLTGDWLSVGLNLGAVGTSTWSSQALAVGCTFVSAGMELGTGGNCSSVIVRP